MERMTEKIEEKIALLHASKTKVCLVAAGAGAGCQNLISKVPGASATLLACFFPYSREALTDFIGFEPERSASEETSLRMAARAWRIGAEIATKQGEDPSCVIGLGVTAVIATNRPLKGDHRVYISVRAREGFLVSQIVFAKKEDGLSFLGRTHEGELCDILSLNMILHSAGIEQVSLPNIALTGDLIRTDRGIIISPRKIERNVEISSEGHTFIEADGVRTGLKFLDSEKHILFWGSFNPFHFGHERIAKEAEARVGKKVVYGITNNHPVKGKVCREEILARINQFQYLAPVLVANDIQLYVEKVKAFRGFTFIIGADVLEMILDVRYYRIPVREVLREFSKHGTRFFVANRHCGNEFVSFNELRKNIPVRFRGMFEQLSSVIDISSTKIRRFTA